MPVSDGRPLRVAVIGSGLAGLTTAYLLRQQGVEVWLIEKAPRLGFHSASVDVSISSTGCNALDTAKTTSGSDESKRVGRSWTVDVPMRSFQGGYYPLLIALYRHLGLQLVPTFYTFSFSSIPYPLPSTSPSPSNTSAAPIQEAPASGSTYFIYSGASGTSLPSLPSRYLGSPIRLIRGVFMFISTMACFLLWATLAVLTYHDILPRPLSRDTPLGDFSAHVASHLSHPFGTGPIGRWIHLPLASVWEGYISRIIVPLFGAVGTMTTHDVYASPIGSLMDYVHTTIGTAHYTLASGTGAAEVAKRLAAKVREQGSGYVKLGQEVTDAEVLEGGEGVCLRCNPGYVVVDKVVVATQASAAKKLLGMIEASLSKLGKESEKKRIDRMLAALEDVEYRETIVVTHRDTSILPPRPDRREINLHLPEYPTDPRGQSRIRAKRSARAEITPYHRLSEGSRGPTLPSVSDEASGPETGPSAKKTPYFAPQPNNIYTMATHIMLPPRHLADAEPVLQTTNPVVPLAPETVLGCARLERALPLLCPKQTLRNLHPEMDRTDGLVYLAGSYAHPGIPLLEGCIGSAIRACEAITGKQGHVDWTAGLGGRAGRIWRWRRRKITAF